MPRHRIVAVPLAFLLAASTIVAAPRWTVTSTAPEPGEALAFVNASGALVVFQPELGRTWSWGASWTDLGPAPETLGRRYETALVHDRARDRAVLFGGRRGTTEMADTWELDGATWIPGPVAPPALAPRVLHAMAYDAARRLTVLFGGSSSYDAMDDTWLYDGASWAPGPPPGSGPPARADSAMGFDDGRGVVVLFGGWNQQPDTWELDASGWQQGPDLPPGSTAPAGARMCYLPATGHMVMFGGYFDKNPLGDTWLYDGISWTAGTQGPARTGHGFATLGQIAVLFGGAAHGPFSSPSDDLWTFDGAAWQEQAQSSPGARWGGGLASERRGVLLVGGKYGYRSLRDAWSYDGAWTDRGDPPAAFGGRWLHAMAYDVARDRVVLFGGSAWNPRDDTWEIDGSAWSPGPPAPSGLTARYGHAMAYDERRQRVVLFGGEDGSETRHDDTWEYDGASWVAGPASPGTLTPRSGHSLTYDGARQTCVLIGGMDANGPLRDVWEYDGGAWVRGVEPPPSFGARHDHLAAYHAPTGQTVVYGGAPSYEVFPDLWLYDGMRWRSGPRPPEATGVGGMAADRQRGVLVLFDSRRRTMEYGEVAESIVAGQGLAAPNGNEVRAFDAAGAGPTVSFLAYGAGQWGVNVAAAHVDSDEHDRILTGPGPGAVYGPHCRAFGRTGMPVAGISFFAYGTLKYGVGVGGGDVDGDAFEEILTGPGAGAVFGPHVRGWNADGSTAFPLAGVSFYAYATLRYGVNVAGGDVDADGYAEILTGPGPSPAFAPQVRGFDHDGGGIHALPGLDFVAFASGSHGAVVAGGDVDADHRDEMAVGPGPGTSNRTRILGYAWNGSRVRPIPGFDVRPSPTSYGARASLADLDAEGRAELLAAAGPDPSATARVQVYAYDGATLLPGVSFDAFPSMYGANVSGAMLGH